MPYFHALHFGLTLKLFKNIVGSPSVSTENLSRLTRAPSLPRNRGRSGIPVAHHREVSRGSIIEWLKCFNVVVDYSLFFFSMLFKI